MSRKVLVDLETLGNINAKRPLNIDWSVQHIRLRDTDRADFANHGFMIDMNSETGRFYFYENPTFFDKLRMYASAHATLAHDIEFLTSAGTAALWWDDSAGQWSVGGNLSMASTKGVFLSKDPTASNEAVTKQYVDQWLPVSNGSADLTGGTISTTNGVKQSMTLDIPASWLTYRITARWSVGAYVSGTLTSQRTITTELRQTNVAGNLFGRSRPALGTAAQGFTSIYAGCDGFVGGQTATGTITIVGCASMPADSGQASWRDGILTAIAHRVT